MYYKEDTSFKELTFIVIVLLLVVIVGLSFCLGIQIRTCEKKVQDAYLKGIAAEELPYPYELKSNTRYVIQTYWNTEDSTVVSIVYPGLE